MLIYRDGYWLGEGDEALWVFNREATARVHAADGSIAELSLQGFPEVHDQRFKIDLDQAKFILRNQPEHPIPEEAPATIDIENMRLVLIAERTTRYGPAPYETRLEPRLCYEIDGYIEPEHELFFTGLVDTETGDVRGWLDFMPSSLEQEARRVDQTPPE